MIDVLLSTTFLAACENWTKTHVYVYIIKLLTKFFCISGHPLCPVASFKKYLDKLNPKSEDLWQRSLYSFTENSTTWYMDQPLGKNTLGNMLKTICKQSGLNYIYTNHSLRATSITVLYFNKFEERNIMAVSDDRSESSLKKYRNKPSKTRIHEMSTGLIPALIDDVEKKWEQF